MGKTRGHGTRRGGSKGRPRGKGRGEEDESGSSDEEYEAPRGLGGQAANVGMLPPSDSEDEEEEGGKDKAKGEEEKPKAKAKPAGQPKTAGMLPPSGSEDDEEDSGDDDGSDDESSEEAPAPAYLTQPAARKKKDADDEPDPEQMRKDMERLELIKQRREQDRLKRIRDEGWDRFAPVSETNKPPGHTAGDHPSRKE